MMSKAKSLGCNCNDENILVKVGWGPCPLEATRRAP